MRKEEEFYKEMNAPNLIRITKEVLINLYVDEKLSSRECAIRLNTTHTTIQKLLRTYNIDRRSISEANKGNGIGISRNKRHGLSKTRWHRIWSGIKTRCLNEKSQAYEDYGGRGITIDPRWLVFENFYNDMKDGYADDLTIDRVDNNKGYCKDNCKWSTMLEQSHNKRSNVYYEIDGEIKTFSEWARHFGIQRETARKRILNGKMSIEQCFKRKDAYALRYNF